MIDRTMFRRHSVTVVLVACVGLAVALQSQQPPSAVVTPTREAAYRANNLGVALLEQFEYPGAVDAFRRALVLDGGLAIARLNLGIALFYGGDTAGASREIGAAGAALAGRPQADYMRGLIARAADDAAAATAAFERVRALDPEDPGTLVNLGQLLRQQRREAEAAGLFRQALASEPFNATAAYGLGQALLRSDQTAEGEAAMARFEALRERGFAITYSQTYLEQGRYAEAVASTGAETDLVDARDPGVTFSDATAVLAPTTARATPVGAAAPGSVTLVDVDDDGRLDLVESGPAGLRVMRNAGGRLADATGTLPTGVAAGAALAAVASDYDNDGRTDLALLRPAGLALLRQDAQGGFADATATAGLAATPGVPRSAAWLDADHDGDADLFVAFGAAGAPPATRLYRNDGNGRFTDVSDEAGVSTTRLVTAVVPTDFDNRRDIDVLLAAANGAPLLFRNLREGSFRDVAADVGLSVSGDVSMVAAGDINQDGFVDFFFARPADAGLIARSDGRGRFTMIPAPAAAAGASAAQFADYDADGLLDLVVLTSSGLRVIRNLGPSWTDVTDAALPAGRSANLAGATSLATGDLDNDGRLDVVVHGPAGLSILRGTGGQARAVRVRLRARVSHRTAAGAKVEMRAGSLRQRLEVYSAVPAPAPAGVRFGVGARPGADVVRVLWPSGILQAETAATVITGPLTIEELDRKPSSCPYLFTWNGERFEFITDFMGGGESGYWVAPGTRAAPDPDEYVRIDGNRLRPRNGRYELRVTNELEEALFVDRAELVVVSHPSGVEVHPNEGLGAPVAPFTVFTTRDAVPPVAVVDDRGRNVRDLVERQDRRVVDGFEHLPIRGYAAEHTLTLTMPLPGASGQRRLLLTGWTDYAFSSDNVAARQAGLVLTPPSLEVRDETGRWRTAIESIGIPVGRPQTVVVDLSRAVPASAREVRIRTSMRIYWDRIQVDTSGAPAPTRIERLDAVSADLSWRGFSKPTSPDGREPFGFDYATTSPHAPWKLLPGRYTRLGDVRTLLSAVDDMFVVSRPGDQIALAFDAGQLAPLPGGWSRTFLLYADGFSKEMNLHSASPDVLEPLPFHGMTAYPYAPPQAYPSTAAHLDYLTRFNTRVVARTLPPLELAGPQR